MDNETVVSSPAPAGGDSGGSSSPSEEGMLESFVEGPESTETPVSTDVETPVETETPVEETPVEGEVTEEAPAEDPNAPAKPLTEAEKAANETLKKGWKENVGQVQEFIKAHPEARPLFFKAAELNQLYATVEDAKTAKEYAGTLQTFDNLYYSGKPEDTRNFLQSLYENAKEPDGSAPHYDRMASAIVTDAASNLATRIQQGDANISRAFSDLGLNGKQAMVAVQAVAAMLGIKLNGVKFNAPTASSSGGQPAATMSEREQYLAQQVAEANAEIERMRGTTLAQTESSFYNGIQSNFHQKLAAEIDKRLEPATALKTQKPFFVSALKSEISNKIQEALRSDTFFGNQMESASRSGNRGPEHQQRLIAALEQRARHYAPDIIREVLAGAGITIQKTNAAGARTGTPRREPATGGTPGRLTKPGTPASKRQPGESYSQYADRLLEVEK